ncbi:sulfatase-like hydrolase/transferase [Tunicatimonas pelagia]|uniref:sulfatase-like hydrolase/transferase n=1 Tax=Tunicatimonas pelagia TaxID=931531 RepID=UPI0026666A17|nr:sulfatase-like hydrolase/transferase [Tunicatimonas pelagia]WKN42696.1 sulfatase-like hydrolase/transferase [Tunicatimonas pelagia]
MKVFTLIFAIIVTTLTLNAQTSKRAILLYVDGFHPDATKKYKLPNIQELIDGGTEVEEGVMAFPIHPTIWPYGQYHTTSFPNISTLAGTLFLDEKQHFFPDDLADTDKTLHSAGSNSYRSLNVAFDFHLTESGLKDSELIDFFIVTYKEEGDLQFSRIHLQELGGAGRVESGKNLSNDPWAQNIWAENSPYSKKLIETDKQIGRLIDFLRESDLLDSTLIVFMGDGQAPTGWHTYMDEEASLTPIVFYGSNIKNGYKVKYAENIDVIPTIAKAMNVKMNFSNGGTGMVLTEIFEGNNTVLEHPQWVKRINSQLREYTVLKAKADIRSAEDPKMNILLMELMHSKLSEYQFYNYDRLLEWKSATSLETMYKANENVLGILKDALDGNYRFSKI